MFDRELVKHVPHLCNTYSHRNRPIKISPGSRRFCLCVCVCMERTYRLNSISPQI